jgi:hypothetical protein
LTSTFLFFYKIPQNYISLQLVQNPTDHQGTSIDDTGQPEVVLLLLVDRFLEGDQLGLQLLAGRFFRAVEEGTDRGEMGGERMGFGLEMGNREKGLLLLRG